MGCSSGVLDVDGGTFRFGRRRQLGGREGGAGHHPAENRLERRVHGHRRFQYPEELKELLGESRGPALGSDLVERRRTAPGAVLHPVGKPRPDDLEARDRERPDSRQNGAKRPGTNVDGLRRLVVVFSLGAGRGLSIFAAGSPSFQAINCTTHIPTGVSTPAAGVLAYSASTGRYTYTWQSSPAWAGTCDQLAIVLNDGTSHPAYFRFTK